MSESRYQEKRQSPALKFGLENGQKLKHRPKEGPAHLRAAPSSAVPGLGREMQPPVPPGQGTETPAPPPAPTPPDPVPAAHP